MVGSGVVMAVVMLLPGVSSTGASTELSVKLRYLEIHETERARLVYPDEVWIEDTLGEGRILLGGPVYAFQTMWRVVIGSDTFGLIPGDTLNRLDLNRLSLQALERSSPPEAGNALSSPVPSHFTKKLQIQSLTDTLQFSHLMGFSPESQQKLQNLLLAVQNFRPRRVKLRVVGSATPSGDPTLNEHLARWRALKVVHSLLKNLTEDVAIQVEIQTHLNTTGKWASVQLQMERSP